MHDRKIIAPQPEIVPRPENSFILGFSTSSHIAIELPHVLPPAQRKALARLQEGETRLFTYTSRIIDGQENNHFRVPINDFLDQLKTTFNRQLNLQKMVKVVEDLVISRLNFAMEEIAEAPVEELKELVSRYNHKIGDDSVIISQPIAHILLDLDKEFSHIPALIQGGQIGPDYPLEQLSTILPYVTQPNPHFRRTGYDHLKLIEIGSLSPFTYSQSLLNLVEENAVLVPHILDTIVERMLRKYSNRLSEKDALRILVKNYHVLSEFLWNELRRGFNGFVGETILDAGYPAIEVIVNREFGLELSLSDEAKHIRTEGIADHKLRWQQIIAILHTVAQDHPESNILLSRTGLHALSPQSICPVTNREAYDIQIRYVLQRLRIYLSQT